METIGGLPATGRRLRGPASDLVELDGSNGLKHTAVVFHPEYRGHNAINDALLVVKGFLESPWVTGLVELVAHDAEQGAFLYPTGQVWSVAETTRMLADLGEEAGVRAGLKLMYAAGSILVEAAETGQHQGVYSHGGLTPWRIMLRKDGQVDIIGYALPQVEILLFHEDPGQVPREDSFRYCPPERIDGLAEDVTSDLFSLGLIAFELMTGKPVYDGLVNDIRQQAARGEASRRLFRFRERLPQSVRDLLTGVLRPDRADRFADGASFLDAVRRVLSSRDATGVSLMDLMRRVSTQHGRTGSRPENASTSMGTRDDFRKMLGDEAEEILAERKERGVRAWSPPPGRGAPQGDDPASAAGSAPAPAPASAPEPGPASEPEERPRWAPPPGRRVPLRNQPAEDAGAPAAPEAAQIPPVLADDGGLGSLRVSAARRPVRHRAEDAGPDEGLEAATATPEPAPAPAPRFPNRAARPARRAPQLPPPAPASGEQEAAAVAALADVAAARKRLRTSTADLLNRILANPDGEPAGEEANRSPQNVLDEIGRSGLRPMAPPAPPTGGPTLAPSTAAPGLAPPVVPPVVPPVLPPTEAAASAPPAPTVGAPAEGPAAQTPRRHRQPGPPPSVPAPTTALVAAPTPPAPPTLAPPIPAPPTPSTPTAQGPRTPDPIPSTATSQDTARFTISRGPGGRSFRMRLPGTLSTAEAVCWLVGNRVPVRTDLSGALAGWWRLEQGGELLSGDAVMGSLIPEVELVLRFVPNRIVQAEIAIEVEPVPARFLAPVGMAVPVATLIDHLAGWMELPPGGWRLRLAERTLSPWAILADLQPSDEAGPLRLSLRREEESEE